MSNTEMVPGSAPGGAPGGPMGEAGTGSDTTAPTAPTITGATVASVTVRVTLALAPGSDVDDNVNTLTYNIYRDNTLIAPGVTGSTWSETVAADGTIHNYSASMSDPAGNESLLFALQSAVTWQVVGGSSGDPWATVLPGGTATAGELLAHVGKMLLDNTGRVSLNLAQTLDATNTGDTVGGGLLGSRARGFGAGTIVNGVETLFAEDGQTVVSTLVYTPAPTNATRQ
jgi:hypothetical protein